MKKRIGRRLVSLLLTVVTILTMLPAMTLPALAATSGTVDGLGNEDIGLSFTGDAEDPWSANGGGIFGRVKSDLSGIKWFRYSSTLTITNNRKTPATLSFDYTVVLNKGTIMVDGTSSTKGGSFSKELSGGDSIEVSITSGKWLIGTEITMTNVKLVSETNPTVTFQPAENGSYTVDGKTITELYTHNQSSTTAYHVVATPANGYQFLGWYDVSNKKYISTDAETDLNFDRDRTITARFASKTAALFETGGQPFDDLGDAVTYAQTNGQSKITLATDGSIDGSYTIPAGITLLIPFDAAGTLYTSEPGYVNTAETQKAYKTLTMAPGSSITVDGGAISVGGKHYASSGQECCKPTGAYGLIKMQEGSRIMLNNGANLYAWGYITGDGKITAARGATVYEYFQVTDWRGGSATLSMILPPNKQNVFPFSQYYVQNIEAPLTIQNGATEKAYFSVDAAIVHTKSVTIDFIGSNNSLFRIYDGGELTKKYDPKTDRITYTTTGSASLDSLALSVAGYNIDSTDYVLPVNNNMTLNILSGSVAVHCDAALLPGAQITIAQGAELNVKSGKSLYVYDYNTETGEWGPYCTNNKKFVPVPYSPSPNRYKRTEADLVDAKIDVNGTLTAAGSVYTTKSGANICSSEGTGKYLQQGAPGTKTATYQYDGSTKSHDIPITAAKLKNFDGSYTETANASVGQTIPYCTCPTCGKGKWLKDFAAIIDSTGNQPTYHPTLQEAVKQFPQDSNGNTYIKMLHSTTEDIPTENINTNKDLYLDLNGCTVKGDISVTNGYKLYGMDSSTGKDYVTAPSGKIVGKVTGTVAPVFEKPLTGDPEYKYLRYVAIKNEADKEYSFHRFNISVTGYRFELAAPQCALIFCGKFQGDKAAKDYLKSLGFTLKDGKGTEFKKDSPEMSEALKEELVKEDGDAYLFELYLKRSFEKNPPDTAYTEEFSATAQATFKNGGTQDSGTQDSETQQLSFQKAWQNALKDPNMNKKDRDILTNFLNEFGINIEAE